MGLDLASNKKQPLAWEMLTDPQLTKIFFGGGKRSGKTDVVIEYFIASALKFPGSRQLMARRSRNHAEESLWSGSLAKYLNNNVPAPLYELDNSKLRLTFGNRSVIQVSGLDDKARTEKAFGNEYITVYLNEATQLSWSTAQVAMTLTAQVCLDQDGNQAIQKFIMDCNPRGPRHWVRKVGIEHIDPATGKKLQDAKAWGVIDDWTPYDNAANLTADYIKMLEALPGSMRQRMVDGLWVEDEGLVYQEFSERSNVCRECKTPPAECPRAKKAREICCGCDFGFNNPFVWLWGAVDHDRNLLIFKEYYKAERIVEDHAKKIANGPDFAWAVADHDREDAETLRRHGVKTRPAKKFKGSVRAGIDLVKTRLKVQKNGKSRLEICQFADNCIGEMFNYLWNAAKPDEPIKENDHCPDALRYMVTEIDTRGKGGIIAI